MSILKNDAGMIARRHVDSPRPRVAPSPHLRVLICGSGRRSRTFIFGFKARRAASCTIPENIFDF